MSRLMDQKSASERGRPLARRADADVPPPTPRKRRTDARGNTATNGQPHPNLIEHLGPAYTARPDGTVVWHNDAFVDFAAAAWNVPASLRSLSHLPDAVLSEVTTLLESGHVEPARIQIESDGIERIYRGRHFHGTMDGGETVFGYFEDITRHITADRRLTALNEKLTDVIRSTSDWVWETDTSLRLTEVSARIAAITGVPQESHMGKPMLSLGELPESIPGVPNLSQLMRERRPFRNRLFLMRDETGQTHRIHLSATPFFDSETGRFLGYRGTGTDVTRALEAEREAVVAREKLEDAMEALEVTNEHLREALGKAQSASDAKSDFLALTSHELRTPLNAIIGFAELSRRQIEADTPERLPSYLDNILSASGHLVQIIDNLLDTVRIENETVDMGLAATDVGALVRDTVAMIEGRAREAGLVVAVSPVEDDLSVIADETAARQVLINLLTNAIKFTDEGGSIGLDVVRGKEDLLYITVWDTGIGIPVEQQQAVFDRFHRVRSDAFTTNTEGVGIGLHVARNLAQLMGGDITLDSALERGSRFTLALRLWDSD